MGESQDGSSPSFDFHPQNCPFPALDTSRKPRFLSPDPQKAVLRGHQEYVKPTDRRFLRSPQGHQKAAPVPFLRHRQTLLSRVIKCRRSTCTAAGLPRTARVPAHCTWCPAVYPHSSVVHGVVSLAASRAVLTIARKMSVKPPFPALGSNCRYAGSTHRLREEPASPCGRLRASDRIDPGQAPGLAEKERQIAVPFLLPSRCRDLPWL